MFRRIQMNASVSASAATVETPQLGDRLSHAKKKKKKKKLKPAERRIKLRDHIWPGAEKIIWHRLENDGFITIPKLLSLICALLKEIAENDPSRVYLDLWCRTFD